MPELDDPERLCDLRALGWRDAAHARERADLSDAAMEGLGALEAAYLAEHVARARMRADLARDAGDKVTVTLTAIARLWPWWRRVRAALPMLAPWWPWRAPWRRIADVVRALLSPATAQRPAGTTERTPAQSPPAGPGR